MSSAPDFSKMSDAELAAYLNAGNPVQPVDAKTGQPLNRDQTLAVRELAAAGGIDPRAEPGSPRLPRAQMSSQDQPPAGSFYFDPQGHVKQQPKPTSALVTALKGENEAANAFASGVPVVGGFVDEADAATNAALAPAIEPLMRRLPPAVTALLGYDPKADIGGIKGFGDRYKASLNIQRFGADQFAAEHPVIDTASKGAGTVGGALAMLPALSAGTAVAGPEAGILARSAAGSVEGAGIGAADAYGRGTGAYDDPSRIRGAEGGATFGAIGGAALPVAAQVARTGYRASVGRLVDALRGERVVQAPNEQSAAELSRVIRNLGSGEGATPPGESATPAPAAQPADKLDVEQALISAKREPLSVNASNLDDAYLRIARAIGRQDMTPAEAAAAAQKVGPLGVLADTGEGTRDLLRAAINRPGPGATIAAENLRPRQAGIFDPETGSWLARPSALRLTDQAQSGLGLGGRDYTSELEQILSNRKAAAGPAYDKAYAAPAIDGSALSEFSASPMFKRAYGDARSISQREFVKGPDGTEVLQPLPATPPGQLDWRTLDLMKQAMDDMVSTSPKQGIGANAQGAIKGFRQRFVAKLDSLNPDYAPAREAFAGPSAMRDALEEGRSLLSEDAPTVAAEIASRPESEREMLRLGALQALQTKLGNANVTFDAANQAGFLKPNQLAKFKALFPDAKSFADFYHTLDNEKTMFATNQAAFGNSTTAKQLLNVGEGSDPTLEGLGRIAESAPEGNLIGLIKGIHQLGQESPMGEKTASAIVSVLSRHFGEGEMADVIGRLDAAQRRAAMADVLRKSNGAAAGTTASRTVQRDQ